MISKILCKGLEPYFPMFVEEAMWGQDGAVISLPFSPQLL